MASTPFGPGTVLAGRFTLDDLVDDTDGARFWRATDRTLARSVAVHVLPEDDPRADSLLTAARTSALVTDGHLLRVLDAAHEDGVVYVVNEWGSGVSLDRLLAEGPLSPRRAAWVVKEVAEAIATAHRNGVAHGRLLPENVMITEAGSVKLIGFVVDAVLRDQTGRAQRKVTGGDPISAHESDVVNLAALLYAALVGRWPGTEGSSVPDAPAEHGRALRPRQVRAGIPRPLDAICERVLNAGPHTHAVPIETAHEVYAALSDFIGDPSGAPQYDATTVLGPDELAAARGYAADGDDDGEATQVSSAAQPGGGLGVDTVGSPPDHAPGDTGELAATGAMDAVDHPAPPTDEPTAADDHDEPPAAERTQAGTPVFFDEDTGVGWMSDADSRGLRGDGSDSREGPVSAGPRQAAAPPPPLPDLPERPLFADGPRRTASGDTGAWGPATSTGAHRADDGPHTGDQTGGFLRSTGLGGGRMPSSWGPDPEDDGDQEEWDDERPGRRWLALAAVLAGIVVLVIGLVFAFNLGRGGGDAGDASTSPSADASSSAPASKPVTIAGVTDFDPQGDPPEENPDLAPLAIDGKPGTAWRTLTYNTAKFGALKSGIGLLVDLGDKTEVGSVKVTLNGSPTSVELLAAPDAASAPSSDDGLPVVASDDAAGGKVTLTPKKKVRTQWLVVWLTSLPPAAGGGYQGRVAEISVSS